MSAMLTAPSGRLAGVLALAPHHPDRGAGQVEIPAEREARGLREDERRIAMGVGRARFPFVRDLDGFDFAAQPSIDRGRSARSPHTVQRVRLAAEHRQLQRGEGAGAARLNRRGAARAAFEYPGAALGGGAVKRREFRVEVAARLRLRHEMVMAILAAHERGTILAGELRRGGPGRADHDPRRNAGFEHPRNANWPMFSPIVNFRFGATRSIAST